MTQAVAVMFATAKARAIAICSRTMHELEETRDMVLAVSPETAVHLARVDVRNETDVRTFFEDTKARFGTVDVGVSNAGANSSFDALVSSNVDVWWNDYVGESFHHQVKYRKA